MFKLARHPKAFEQIRERLTFLSSCCKGLVFCQHEQISLIGCKKCHNANALMVSHINRFWSLGSRCFDFWTSKQSWREKLCKTKNQSEIRKSPFQSKWRTFFIALHEEIIYKWTNMSNYISTKWCTVAHCTRSRVSFETNKFLAVLDLASKLFWVILKMFSQFETLATFLHGAAQKLCRQISLRVSKLVCWLSWLAWLKVVVETIVLSFQTLKSKMIQTKNPDSFWRFCKQEP